MGTFTASGPFNSTGDLPFIAYTSYCRYILLPCSVIKINGKKIASIVWQNRIKTNYILSIHIFAAEMLINNCIVQRYQHPVFTLGALAFWFDADPIPPLIGTYRCISTIFSFWTVPSPGKYIFTATKQAAKQTNLFFRCASHMRTGCRGDWLYQYISLMFADLLYCADCGKKLWFHVNSINKIHFFSCSNYVKDYRGTCPTRHYIRADSIEQVVKLELRRMAQLLQSDEEAFAAILEKKANADILAEQRHLETELTKAISRSETVAQLYERLYEDNVSGKVTDEWFLQLSHKYEVERMELKEKISETRQRLASLNTMQQNKDHFLAAVRKFMEMETLTPPLLRELIDHIDVYETQGTGKHRTQRITIFYRFVGYIDLPESPDDEPYTAEPRQGVAVKYIPKMA